MQRNTFLALIAQRLKSAPVVALLGPRQCGKTTLARQFAEFRQEVHFFDLEDPTDLAVLENPKLALQDLSGLVVLDEIQRLPDLFPVLRVLVDRPEAASQFLILGSASRDLIRQSSETLAGRISYLELTPFQLGEVGVTAWESLWERGGFPRSFLETDAETSRQWRKDYGATFLERDLPALGIGIPPQSLRRFWQMLAHCHGQLVNFSEFGRSFGVADTTVRRYLDVLEATFMVRRLRPWHENLGKRQVKTPKVYLRDSGMYHTLLGIHSLQELRRHPKLGPSWEGFALEEVVRHLRADPEDTYFWATHSGAELDLLIFQEGRRLGFEIKYTDRPRMTRSMRTAAEALKLDHLSVLHPGEGAFPLAENIRAVGLRNLLSQAHPGGSRLSHSA